VLPVEGGHHLSRKNVRKGNDARFDESKASSTEGETARNSGSYTQSRRTGVTSILIWTPPARTNSLYAAFSGRRAVCATCAPGMVVRMRSAILFIAASMAARDLARGSRPTGHSRQCSRTGRDRYRYVQFYENRRGTERRARNAGLEANRQTGRRCGCRCVSGVRRGREAGYVPVYPGVEDQVIEDRQEAL